MLSLLSRKLYCPIRKLATSAIRCASSSAGNVYGSSDIFPWRTKPSLLNRLVPGTDEYTKLGLLLTSKSQRLYGDSSLNAIVTAYMFLNVPWYELVWISHFKNELSSSISWAFTHGVANLLSKLSSSSSGQRSISVSTDCIIIPALDDTTNYTCGIDFHETLELCQNNNESNYNTMNIKLQKMFQEKVISHYESAATSFAKQDDNDDDNSSTSSYNHSKHQRLEVRLKMIPYDTELISLYSIPYLSRRNAKENPELLKFYREMLGKPSVSRASYLSQLRKEHLENKGHMESTVIAQCIVWCDELFYVKDLTTGQIIQGQEEQHRGEKEIDPAITVGSKKIPHLVRMEKTVITKRDPISGTFENEQQDWIITDIDDIVGGNLII
mmetsp:Transcript_62311/g.69714  ORF Transcript_62311/g.69714 Transcript_62311/m.69714 type:complete len:383 (+) Transcript_62311:16-1164(+)